MKICGVDYGLTTCFAVIDFTPAEVRIIDIQNHNLILSNGEQYLLWKRLEKIHLYISNLLKEYEFDLIGIESAKDKLLDPHQFKFLSENKAVNVQEMYMSSPYLQQIGESFNSFNKSVWLIGRRYEFMKFFGRKEIRLPGKTEAYGKILRGELRTKTGLKGYDARDAVAVAIALGCFQFDCSVPNRIKNDWLIKNNLPWYYGKLGANNVS